MLSCGDGRLQRKRHYELSSPVVRKRIVPLPTPWFCGEMSLSMRRLSTICPAWLAPNLPPTHGANDPQLRSLHAWRQWRATDHAGNRIMIMRLIRALWRADRWRSPLGRDVWYGAASAHEDGPRIAALAPAGEQHQAALGEAAQV